jgi:hypothetical protein
MTSPLATDHLQRALASSAVYGPAQDPADRRSAVCAAASRPPVALDIWFLASAARLPSGPDPDQNGCPRR